MSCHSMFWCFLFASEVGGYTLVTGCSIAFVWFFSIAFGRLYLGAHTPTDVRGKNMKKREKERDDRRGNGNHC